jgi:hypothetical protein
MQFFMHRLDLYNIFVLLLFYQDLAVMNDIFLLIINGNYNFFL